MNGIVIGTRGSPLAMWQANYVRDTILEGDKTLSVELKVIKTLGDQALREESYGSLDKGLFTTEIENELLAGSISIAVHSLKDLPTELPDGLTVGAIPVREDPADALISKSGASLKELPKGAKVFTGSLRRRGQLLHLRDDLQITPVRGNVQTRLRKLDESDTEATVLARAGLLRSGLAGRITERLDPVEFLPACGQGALALEIREDNAEVQAVLQPFDDLATRLAVTAERAFLKGLGGGCQVPIGAYARFTDDGKTLVLTGMVSSLCGQKLLRDTISQPVQDELSANSLGRSLTNLLREQGCQEILNEVLEQSKPPSGDEH